MMTLCVPRGLSSTKDLSFPLQGPAMSTKKCLLSACYIQRTVLGAGVKGKVSASKKPSDL
jgi:hypothetical protein